MELDQLLALKNTDATLHDVNCAEWTEIGEHPNNEHKLDGPKHR